MKRWIGAIAMVAGVASAKPALRIATPSSLALPGGEAGIGFDDLMWSHALGRVLVPGGRTGKLDLIDPATRKIESVSGFTDAAKFAGGHGEGTTSVDSGGGLLFASDRGRQEVIVVDPRKHAIVSRAKLAGRPDYVRWVEPLSEVWVTEPNKKQIEVFALTRGTLARKLAIPVPGGPESLVIDRERKRAYTHTWTTETVAIALDRHAEVARWKNGCKASRGIALDEARALLFVGCEEGKATALDVVRGTVVGQVPAGKGVDIIAYAPKLGHLYVPGGDDATLSIIAVGKTGTLTTLGSVAVAADAHCVTVDEARHAYVCDPKHGALLVVTDPFR